MNDFISRQTAIDDLHGKDPSQIWDTADIEVWLNALPSAQPEQRVCKTCKHYPPEKKWPCVDCDMREPADRWEEMDNCPSAQPEPQWISCSERYPDMDERVLVYTVAHEYHVWDCMSNRADNYFWEDEAGLYHDKYEVDLWLPLPEPYAERRTDG